MGILKAMLRQSMYFALLIVLSVVFDLSLAYVTIAADLDTNAVLYKTFKVAGYIGIVFFVGSLLKRDHDKMCEKETI